jgi:anthranilate phosphoribosyltransferase
VSTPLELLPADPAAAMRSIIKRIATGPELSKDISREEARLGMQFVLERAVDPVQAGIFLIALRMKRETDEENEGILEALLQATHTVTAPVSEVLDLADPYDGFTRTLPASPFLPAVLAACGVATVSHGVERMGPKYGVTHRQVLAAAGVPVDLSPAQGAEGLADPRVGWAYADQSVFCPKLHDLAELRTLIVKRPAITTCEGLLGPIRGQRRTHLVTGYVHKPYPRIYALLARRAGFDSALIVRGVEGGVIASLRQAGKAFHYRREDNGGVQGGGDEQPVEFSPSDFGIDQPLLAPPIPGRAQADQAVAAAATGPELDNATVARAAADAGLAALSGEPGPTRDSLVCGAALCLWHLQRHATLHAAAAAVRQVLDSGQALSRLESARSIPYSTEP